MDNVPRQKNKIERSYVSKGLLRDIREHRNLFYFFGTFTIPRNVILKAFWSCWTKLQESFPKNISKSEVTYRLFKDGVTPSWEDPSNIKGGKFSIKMERIRSSESLQKTWLSLVIALLIGELGHDTVVR